MNAYMNIQIRVLSQAAQRDIARVQNELNGLKGGIAAPVRGSGIEERLRGMVKSGSQMQWVGRQIMYNFTLPILAAGAAATKFEMDNEKAFTQVVKVYGDGSAVFNRLSKTELPALRDAFEELSNFYGVQQKEVDNIAASWAAAGASGIALAKSVETTLATMVLGELDAKDATDALIAIQAQYGQSVGDLGAIVRDGASGMAEQAKQSNTLANTISILNMVENQTGITMGGLVDGMARAAGVARSAGIDVRHLAAMLAAMVPAAGSASNAGNALRTIISRLLAPTGDAVEILGKLGITTADVGWKSLNGAQRLEVLAKRFVELNNSSDKTVSAQAAVVSSIVASRWQINRFDVLMRDIVNTNGYYQKALNATESATANYMQVQKELNTVLQSNPQRFKQIMVILQNTMADVIQPMLPLIIGLASEIAKLATWFSNLNPYVQKTVMFLLLFIATSGILVRYIGATKDLLGELGLAFLWSGRKAGVLLGGLSKIVAFPFELIANGFGAIIGGMRRLFVMGTYTRVFGGIWLRVSALWTAAFGIMEGTLAFFVGVIRMSLAGTLTTAMTWARGFAARIAAGLVAANGSIITWARVFIARVAFVTGATLSLTMTWVRLWIARFYTAFAASTGSVFNWARIFIARIMFALGASLSLSMTWARGFFARIAAGLAASSAAALTFSRAFVARIAAGMVMASRAVLAFALSPSRWLPLLAGGFQALGRVAMAFGARLVPVLFGPWGIAIAAVLAIVAKFHDQIGTLFHSVVQGIINAFNALPTGVRSALLAVVHMVEAAAMAVYRAFQYMNPFAHHSPSLVENTEKGMGQVQGHHKAAVQTAQQSATATHQATAAVQTGGKQQGGGYSKATLASIEKYNRLMKEAKRGTDDAAVSLSKHSGFLKQVGGDLDTFNGKLKRFNTLMYQFHDQRVAIKKIDPGAIASFDKLIEDLGRLNRIMAIQQRAVDKQQQVVDKWAARLDNANAAVDRENAKLSKLQARLDSLNAALEQHQQALQNWANAPIKGERAMSDAIFDNEIAQKKLRLEMMKMEDAVGPLDQLQKKLADIQGEIEKLSGEEATLRQSGAGSEILKTYDDQIKALKGQQVAIQDQAKPIQDMQDQIDALANKGEELQLLNDITFDPLHRQIDELVNATKEFSFDDIVAGINSEQKAIADLLPQIAAAQAAVDQQQAVVDAAQAAKDAIQDRYDAENAALQQMQDALSATKDAADAVTNALNTMGAAAEKAVQAREAVKKAKGSVSPAVQDFKDAAGGAFPDVGGNAKIGREGGLGDQSDMINSMSDDIRKSMGNIFSDLNIFAPLKGWWDKTVSWFEGTGVPALKKVWAGLQSSFKGDNPFAGMDLSGVGKVAVQGFNQLKKEVTDVVHIIIALWNLIEPDVRRVFDAIRNAISRAIDKIGPQLAGFGELIGPLIEAMGHLWNVVKVLAEVLGVILLPIVKIVFSVIGHVAGPVFNFLIDGFANLLQIIRGFVRLVLAIINGDWSQAWKALGEIVGGVFKQIWNIIASAGKILLGLVEGIVFGIVGFFKWLWDELVGHSIIPDMINAIVDWFTRLPEMALNALLGLGASLVGLFTSAFTSAWDAAKSVWGSVTGWLSGLPADAYNTAKDLVTKMGNLGHEAWTAIWDKAKKVWGDIHDWINGLGDKAKNALDDMTDKLGKIGHEAWTAIWDKAKEVWGNIHDWINGLGQKAKDAFSDITDKLSGLATDAFNGFLDAAKKVWTDIKDWVGGLGAVIEKKASGMWDGISNAFTSALGAVKSAWNAFAKFWNAIEIKIPEINTHIPGVGKIGGQTIGLPNLPMLARGGITGGPAIVGEGRSAYPEFVIPTDPAFRTNAMALFASLGTVLGLERNLLGAITGGSLKSAPMMASGGIVGSANARIAATTRGLTPSGGGDHIELNFYGDLSFPNITSGEDAETFVSNLESLAG